MGRLSQDPYGRGVGYGRRPRYIIVADSLDHAIRHIGQFIAEIEEVDRRENEIHTIIPSGKLITWEWHNGSRSLRGARDIAFCIRTPWLERPSVIEAWQVAMHRSALVFREHIDPEALNLAWLDESNMVLLSEYAKRKPVRYDQLRW